MKSLFAFIVCLILLIPLVKADKKIDIGFEVQASDSSISILDANLEDMVLSANVLAFRGDTLKRTVYVKVVDIDNKTISSVEKMSLSKFNQSSLSVSLIVKKCSGKIFLLAYGLGVSTKKEFSCGAISKQAFGVIEGSDSKDSVTSGYAETTPSQKDISYNISFPPKVSSGENFSVRVMFNNPTSETFDIDAWSYVYHSSRCYSGDREKNRKTVFIPEFSNVTFDLPLQVLAKSGNYSLKFKVLFPDKKIPKELTYSITIDEFSGDSRGPIKDPDLITGKVSKTLTLDADLAKDNGNHNDKDDGNSKYLSSSAKTKKLLPFLIILALAIILSMLVFKVL